MNRALDRVARTGVPVLVAFAAFVGALGVLGAHGFAVRHMCTPHGGILGLLSSDFALVRQPSDCPASTVSGGGQPVTVVTVVAVLTIPVLLAQCAALAAAAMAATATRRVVCRAVRLAAAVLGAVLALVRSRPAPPMIPEQRDPGRWWVLPPQRDRLLVGPLVIRGPPRGVLAVS